MPHVNDVKDLERYPRDRKPTELLWPLAFVAAFAAVGWFLVTH